MGGAEDEEGIDEEQGVEMEDIDTEEGDEGDVEDIEDELEEEDVENREEE